MARNAPDPMRAGHDGAALQTEPARASPGHIDGLPDVDLAGVLNRLSSNLEHFEAAMAIERGRIEHPMPFDQPGRHSERISSSVTALVAELMQILTLLRRLRESDELYGQAPVLSGGGPGRGGQT